MPDADGVTAREWSMLIRDVTRIETTQKEQGEKIEELADLIPAFKAMKASYDRFGVIVATSAGGVILTAIGVLLFGRTVGG